MEPSVIFLLVIIVVLILFLTASLHDGAEYKGRAEAYESMLVKAGLIDEPVVTKEEEEGPNE